MDPTLGGACDKLRLMCSYGGHIVPRPHDKSLFYAGGETRLIAVSRKTASSLSSLTSHLAKSFPYPNPSFSVKYQLPNHDLGLLISISTDEDLVNMLDEYDRLAVSPTPSRIRFFLFSASADDGKNFCNNVGAGGLHNPKTEDWFIDALRSTGVKPGSGASLPESISMEERERERQREESSFGSNSSSSYSPAVVRVNGGEDDSGVNIGGHLQDIKVALPSVDSLGSDRSFPSPNFSQQSIVYQDASGYPELKPVPANHIENESNVSDSSPHSDMQTPVQVSGYILSKPINHPPQTPSPPPPSQQYIHQAPPRTHYVYQYYPSAVPVPSYPTMYQPYIRTTTCPIPPDKQAISNVHDARRISKNPYAMPPTVAHNQPQVGPNPVMVASHMVYEGYKPASPAPEYAAKVYMATEDHHHQVVAFPPPNPASQPVAVSSLETTNYLSDYEDPMHAQIYKSQPSGPTLPSQVQTTVMTETAMLSESLAQLQVENTAKQ